MDWIQGMQRTIDYNEEHLTEEIDYDAVAARAFHQAIIFREFSVFFADLLWASIFVIVGWL